MVTAKAKYSVRVTKFSSIVVYFQCCSADSLINYRRERHNHKQRARTVGDRTINVLLLVR